MLDDTEKGMEVISKCVTCAIFEKCFSSLTLCKVYEGDFEHYREDSVMVQMKQNWNNGHWDDSGE